MTDLVEWPAGNIVNPTSLSRADLADFLEHVQNRYLTDRTGHGWNERHLMDEAIRRIEGGRRARP